MSVTEVQPAKKPEESSLYVKTTVTTRLQFGAACKLAGVTIQDRVNGFMEQTIRESGIQPRSTA